MAKRNYREIQEEYLRTLRFVGPPGRGNGPYHQAEPVALILKRLSRPTDRGGHPELGCCHEWLGQHSKRSGRAQISYRVNKRRFKRNAAALAYEVRNGPMPEGKEASHVCLNEWCVNPDHILAETHSENMQRKRRYRFRLRCPRCGGPKDMVPSKNRGGEWTCIPCRAKRAKEWRERTGYSFNDYREGHKDQINANRRAARAKARREVT
jgi:hypothetical protein